MLAASFLNLGGLFLLWYCYGSSTLGNGHKAMLKQLAWSLQSLCLDPPLSGVAMCREGLPWLKREEEAGHCEVFSAANLPEETLQTPVPLLRYPPWISLGLSVLFK